jgi:glucosamine--fructose-6-phosphate aminotransferase (isomerizing)
MCGIVGVIGKTPMTTPVTEIIFGGLKRLEYRGYDSAGIATLQQGVIRRVRAEGKLDNLRSALDVTPLEGISGIGHTRWATHGAPSETNAHPHATEKVAVVHNGIIENYRELRSELTARGYAFSTQTDSEVIPMLLTSLLDEGKSAREAVCRLLERLEGAFALAMLFRDTPEAIYIARRGAPLAIGHGDGIMYIGSDAIALAPYTNRITYLEEGDWAEITASGAQLFNDRNESVTRPIKISSLTGASVGKGEFRHFMLKEIYEQPIVIGETLRVYSNAATGSIGLPELPFALEGISRVQIIACGTSYYAGMVAKYWLEHYARVSVEVDIASEYRYRQPVFSEGMMAVFISQSGETADTLAAMRLVKENNIPCLAILNSPESSMANLADGVLPTYAGPEIGVASTKAFTTQLVTLACLSLALASARKAHDAESLKRLTFALAELPSRVAEVLNKDSEIAEIAHTIFRARDVLYLGRGTSYPIALEGALKLKEISYIHAEGYAAGELKHGPIALIDEHVPVIVTAPRDAWFEKTASNVQEVAARGGKVLLISDSKGVAELQDITSSAITLPEINPFVSPILYALPVQLLAYHIAVLKGTDVDQPRNLAKSVTVE